MISELDRLLGSRYFLNNANERTGFASCLSVFKSTGLLTCLEYISSMFLLCLNEINGGWEEILQEPGSF